MKTSQQLDFGQPDSKKGQPPPSPPQPLLGLPNLSRHLRNLAYAIPVVRLSLERRMLAPNEPQLFERTDLNYAAMALIVFLMERRTTDLGAERTEIIEYMGRVFGAMRPDHSSESRRRAADIVLEALTNRTDQHQAFKADYFDPCRGIVPHEFRLINITSVEDGRILYTATDEAIVLHLAMLDVDPTIAQRAEEMMLKYLVDSGRFRESVELAERARARSMQYQQFIRTKIFEARRAPESVRWSREVVPELRAAAEHVYERKKHELTILDAIFANQEHAGPDSSGPLHDLQRLIEDCQARHSSLHQELLTAAEEFLALQTEVFRPRFSSILHELERDTLMRLLSLPVRLVAANADSIAALLSPPRFEKMLSLADLFEELVTAPPEKPAPPSDGDGDLEPIVPVPDPFPAPMQVEVEAYLNRLLRSNAEIDIEAVLARAERDGLDRKRRRFAVFLMLQAFHPEENPFGGRVNISSAIARFTSDVAAGSRLLFEGERTP